MAEAGHDPEWPDKIMFAAMTVTLGGGLAVLFSLLMSTGATIGNDIPGWLLPYPPWVGLLAGALMILLGTLAIRFQAAVWVWLGVVAGLISMGMLGLVPILSLVAIIFLVMSHVEGEETIHDDDTWDASLWPDKALAASLMLLVAGIVSLFQAGMLFADNLTAPLFPDTPSTFAFINVVAGAIALYGAFEVFHVRRPWAGWLGAVAGVAGLGFYVLGPGLAITAMILLLLAHREDEFTEAALA